MTLSGCCLPKWLSTPRVLRSSCRQASRLQRLAKCHLSARCTLTVVSLPQMEMETFLGYRAQPTAPIAMPRYIGAGNRLELLRMVKRQVGRRMQIPTRDGQTTLPLPRRGGAPAHRSQSKSVFGCLPTKRDDGSVLRPQPRVVAAQAAPPLKDPKNRIHLNRDSEPLKSVSSELLKSLGNELRTKFQETVKEKF